MTYRGWDYYFNADAPVTGRWRATRFGVGMCAGDELALRRMIDQKIEDQRVERAERNGGERGLR